jgi:hypothetical protein
MTWLKRNEWTLVGIAAILAFTLGVVGMLIQSKGAASPFDAIYFSLRLFAFEYDLGQGGADPYRESNLILQVARFLAPATVAIAVIKGAMLIAAQQLNLWRIARWRGHAVVCGAGERGRQLALALRGHGHRVVVIENNETADTLADIRTAGARVVLGSATDPARQAEARLEFASKVAAVTPSEESNLQIVLAASRRRNGLPLRAMAHASRSFAEMFENQPPFDRITNGKDCGFFDHDVAASRVLVGRYALNLVAPLLHERRSPQLLVAGDGSLLPELLGVLITQCQYAVAGIPRILLATSDLAAVERRFPLHHPQLKLVADISIAALPLPQLLQMPLDSVHPGFSDTRFDLAFVACREDIDTLALARNLVQQPGRICRNVVAGLRPSTQMMRLFTGSQPLAGVASHDLVELGCSAEVVLYGKLDEPAREIHGAYLREQIAAGHQPGETPALVPWEELAESLRQANRSQADHISIKRRTMELSDSASTVDALAEAEHRRWMADKILAGWRHGAERDDSRRLHPSMRPYSDLSDLEKQKDRVTVAHALGQLSKQTSTH